MFRNPAPVLSSPAVSRILSEGPLHILEVGAGCLRNALPLLRRGHEVTVLEVARMRDRFPDQYAEFRRRGGRFVEALSSHHHFDLAIMTFVIETICRPKERALLLHNIADHLSVNGSLIISARGPRDLLTAKNDGVRCADGYITPNKSFARSFTKQQMKRLLTNNAYDDLTFLHKPSSAEPEYLHVIARKHGR
jgi:hypothetical protein